jgi:spermidine synthase
MSKPYFEVLDWVETDLGPLCLRRRELVARPGTLVTEVTLDHELLMSSLNTESEIALATLAIEWHAGSDLRVLVGGLGLGYTAHAALASERVAALRVVEALPAVVAWVAEGKIPLASELSSNPAYEAVVGDVYELLLGSPSQTWDLLLIDVDHTPSEHLGPTSQPFYTEAGLRQVAEHLAPGGVLAVWSAGDDDAFAHTMSQAFPESTREVIRWENALIDDGTMVEDVVFLARRG